VSRIRVKGAEDRKSRTLVWPGHHGSVDYFFKEAGSLSRCIQMKTLPILGLVMTRGRDALHCFKVTMFCDARPYEPVLIICLLDYCSAD
jgi:hypothetical protein